jgi:hypothetical protein
MSSLALLGPSGMNPPDEKPSQGGKATTETNPSRSAQIRGIIEDYANDLREIIRKLRRKMN